MYSVWVVHSSMMFCIWSSKCVPSCISVGSMSVSVSISCIIFFHSLCPYCVFLSSRSYGEWIPFVGAWESVY